MKSEALSVRSGIGSKFEENDASDVERHIEFAPQAPNRPSRHYVFKSIYPCKEMTPPHRDCLMTPVASLRFKQRLCRLSADVMGRERSFLTSYDVTFQAGVGVGMYMNFHLRLGVLLRSRRVMIPSSA